MGILLSTLLMLIFFGIIKDMILFYVLTAGVHIFLVFFSGRKDWIHDFDMVEDID